MVAVAILALSLTAIFSGEAGAAKVAQRSRKIGLATLAARCKMNEIEEQIAKEGLPAVFDSDSDDCCKDSPIAGVTCDWEIEPITLPDTMFAPEEPGTDGKDKEGKDKGSNSPANPGSPQEPKPATPGAATAKDPMAAIRDIDPKQALAGGGLGGLASMALGYAYPVLKPGFEAQIRRATVTVHWKEGSGDHSFDVTQYVVADRPGNPDQKALEQLQQLQQQQPQQPSPFGARVPLQNGTGIQTFRNNSNL
jgi:general secretion pathway protein I